MSKKFKKIWNAVTTVCVIIVVLLAVALVGVRLVGFQVFAVLSGSMEPEYPVGSLIYVKEVDPTEIEVRDVITFMMNESTVATHRVIEVIPDPADPDVVRFRTKGDANDAEDGSLVHGLNVIGTPVLTVPYLGYVSSYIQNPPGTYIAIAAAAVVVALTFVPDLLASDEDKNQKNKKQKAKQGGQEDE